MIKIEIISSYIVYGCINVIIYILGVNSNNGHVREGHLGAELHLLTHLLGLLLRVVHLGRSNYRAISGRGEFTCKHFKFTNLVSIK